MTTLPKMSASHIIHPTNPKILFALSHVKATGTVHDEINAAGWTLATGIFRRYEFYASTQEDVTAAQSILRSLLNRGLITR